MKSVILRGMHLCDEVTRDSRNTPSLRGVFPGRVVCPTKPYFCHVHIFGSFEVFDKMSHTLAFSIEAPGSKGDGEIQTDEGVPFFDLEARLPIFIREEGEVKIKWKIDDGRWLPGISWKLKFANEVKELDDDQSKKLFQVFRASAEAFDILDDAAELRSSIRY